MNPTFLGDSRASQVLRIVTLVLVVAVLGGVISFAGRISKLDQDDKLINRGQQVTNCVGDLSDDKFDWLFIAVGEVFEQIEAVAEGNEVDLADGREAVANGRQVAELQEEARRLAGELIDADPEVEFSCPAPPAVLDPDRVPIQ